MRLFIAMLFDQETKRRLLAVQQRLRDAGRGNFSPPENLHLTLAFLGEVDAARLPAVCGAMDRTPIEPMTLTFDCAGCFRRDGGDLWWAGLRDHPALLSLQDELARQLAAAGFPLERRRFSPHITLARAVRLDTPIEDGALLLAPFSTTVDAMSLMRSQRDGGRLLYTEQYRKM